MPLGHDMAATPTLRGLFPSRPAEATPTSRRGRVVAFAVALAFLAPPWLLGAWEAWTQWVTLALALAAFALLFAPMFDYRGWPPSPPARAMWRRLASFPIFWIGLAILAYGIIAALNPWKILKVENNQAWFENLPHVRWLPHSLETPFWEMNAWRALVMIAPAWLVTCAAWTGVETERAWRTLLGAVAANGALLALFGVAQRLSGTRDMYWLYDPRPEYAEPAFFSSFIYAGHAAAWMVLAFGAAAAMLDDQVRRPDPLDPQRKWARPALIAWLWLGALMALLLALGEFVKPDFWVLAAGGILAIWAWLWLSRLWRAGQKRRAALYALPAMLFVAMMLLVTAGAVAYWRQGGAQGPSLEVNPRDPALPVRYAIARTSVAMIKASPLWGWGLGSYRYIAPDYLKKNPLFTEPGHPTVLLYRANHAHSDWVQIPAEWGLAGASLFGAALAWWTWKMFRLRRALPAELWCVIGAVGLIFFGAAADFPFYNPAVLIALGFLLAASARLGEMAQRPRPAASGTGTALA